MSEKENLAVFSGNVSVVQGTTMLKTVKMTVYYVKDGGGGGHRQPAIERLEVDGKVYVKSEAQEATGDMAHST